MTTSFNGHKCLPAGLIAQSIEMLEDSIIIHACSAREANMAAGGSALRCAPCVVGIDDWAWRCRQRYGTLICDLERRCVIDLLPDREPATVEAWLRVHPQIEVVARDRNGGYGGAVSRALPKAVQVADRWPLLENASDAFLSAVRRAMPNIRKGRN